MNSQRFLRAISLAALLVLLAGCSGAPLSLGQPTPAPTVPAVSAPSAVMAEAHIAPRDSANLGFLLAGRVEKVLVKEGDQVKKGDILVQLGDRETYTAAVATAQLALLSAQQALDTLNDNGDVVRAAAELAVTKAQKASDDAQKALDNKKYQRASQQTIDIARANLILANKALEDAEKIYNQNKNRNSDDVVFAAALSQLAAAQQRQTSAQYNFDYVSDLPDPLDIMTAQAALDVAKANLNDAKRNWDKVKDTGVDPDKLALAQSTKDDAQAQVDAAQAALDNLDLVAPYDGLVTAVNISPDEHVTPAEPVITLADFGSWFVETSDLAETDVVKIKVGQPATVTFDSLPGAQLEGVVDSIANGASSKGGDVVYTVKVRISKPDPLLRWGMTANVTFPVEG